MRLTAALEDYLNAIYKLVIKDEKKEARVTDISNMLGVKKSSTNSALNSLKEQGLINYEKYKNITLTKIGLVQAKNINKRHELFRIFLVDIVKTTEEFADKETEQLAHGISCYTAAKLESFIEEYIKENEKKNKK